MPLTKPDQAVLSSVNSCQTAAHEVEFSLAMSMDKPARSLLRKRPAPGYLSNGCPHSPQSVYETRHFSQSARRYATQMANSSKSEPRTAMFFPGQGVQRIGMLKPWLEAFPRTAKPLCEEIDHITARTPRMTELIETGRNDTLTETQNAQPAIMATSIVILRILQQEFDFDIASRVDVTLGHSLGEFAALVAGGYLRFEDALRMCKTRAESMATAARHAREEEGGPVGMVALVCEPGRLDSMIDAIHEFVGYADTGSKMDSAETPSVQQVLIANINSKNQVVISGALSRIRTLLTNLREFGGHDPRAVELKTDCPFHSPLMQPGADAMKRMLSRPRKADGEDVVIWPGLMPCISNVTARPFKSREELKDLLARQCVETVQWWDSIKLLDQEWKIRRWIGIGPGKVGRNLVGKEVGMKGAVKGGGVWGINEPTEVERIMRELEETDKYTEHE